MRLVAQAVLQREHCGGRPDERRQQLAKLAVWPWFCRPISTRSQMPRFPPAFWRNAGTGSAGIALRAANEHAPAAHDVIIRAQQEYRDFLLSAE